MNRARRDPLSLIKVKLKMIFAACLDSCGNDRHSRSVAIALALCNVMAVTGAAHAADAVVPRRDELAVTVDERWNATFASEVRYFSWQATRGTPANINASGGSGTQVYIPFALQIVGQPSDDYKIELLGRGGWVRARQSTGGLAGEVDTATDTVATAAFTYLGFNGVQPFVSLSANLPTGESTLFGTAANARMDPDLVEVSSFGEGWNFGPTVGLSIPVTPSTILSFSAGHTWRGSFNRENSLTPPDPNLPPAAAQVITRLDPGDVFTLTASASYANGPWFASILGSISEETRTAEGGIPLYKPGRRYVGTATLGYSWPESWGMTTLIGSLSHTNRNDVLLLGASSLVTEPMNTNSNLYRIGLQHLVPFGALWAGPTGSVLYRDNNSYDSNTLQFLPAKQRYAAGLIARYAASEKVTFNSRIDRVWTHEDDKPATNGQQFSVLANAFVVGSAVPIVSSRGWQIAGGLNVRF